MNLLLGQIPARNVGVIPATLCDRMIDSERPCVYLLEVVGMIGEMEEDFVCFFKNFFEEID
jgi:hypothetical protein